MNKSPYLAPQVNSIKLKDAKGLGPLVFFIFAIIATILSIVLGLIGEFVMPAFMKIFDAFNPDIPALTMTVFRNRLWLWSAFVMAIFLWCFGWKSRSISNRYQVKVVVGFAVLVVVEISMYAYLVYMLYEPIFKLGRR